MSFLRSRLVLCALLALTPTVPAAQDAGAPPVEEGAGAGQPYTDQGLVPAGAEPAAVAIPDISQHRQVELPYVRRMADIVQLPDLHIDVNADPVLLVGRRPVSRAEFRNRALMYLGGNEIDQTITRLLTQAERERAIAAGADAARFELAEADIDRRFEDVKELMVMQARQQQQPDAPDPADAAVAAFVNSIETSIGMEAYRKMLAADAEFELVFLPMPAGPVEGVAHDFAAGPPPVDEARPEWLPQASWDAMSDTEQGRTMRSFVKNWAIEGTDVPAMFRSNILMGIREGLIRREGLKFFFDEPLGEGVFMRVGQRDVSADELWPLVEKAVTDADRDLILRELLTLEGMQRALQAAGKWMSDEQLAEKFAAHEAEYAGTFFPLKTIIMFRGYTSPDRYREHFRYRQAWVDWRRETLGDEEVMAHYQGGGRVFFERGTATIDAAYAPLAGRQFGTAQLDERAAVLGAALDAARAAAADEPATAAGATPPWFRAVMEEFPAPPPPAGSEYGLQRSQLRLMLAESELSILLTGYSFTDDIFYHGQVGDVFGPYSQRCRVHAWGAEQNAGAWLAHLRGFSRRTPLTPFEGRARDLAYEDFLDLNFFWWAQESLKAILGQVALPG